MSYDTTDRWNDLESLLALIESAWFTDEHPLTVHSRNYDSDTPLHTAITWGDLRATEVLILAGAELNALGEDGDTPLHHAIRMGEFKIARLLIAHGARQDIRNVEGKRPCDYCSEAEWPGFFGVANDI
jgi:ankyrin repeat protein